jgi:hypothetical protein
MFDLMKGIFFDTDEGSGGGSGDPAPAAPVTPPPASQDVPRVKPTNIKSFLEKAPKMTQPKQGAPPGPDDGAPAPAQPNVPEPAKPGEAVKDEPGEKVPLVQGPSKQPPSTPEPGTPAAEEEPKPGEPGPTTFEPGQKVKIGDLEHTVEEWERFGKDYANDMTWKANNTKRSQLVNKFSDEQLNDMAPYALAQREIPKDLKKSLLELQEMPEELTVKDGEGYDVKIPVSELPDEFLNKLKNQILTATFPEYMNAVDENTRLKEQVETTQHEVSTQEIEDGTAQAVGFMQGHPEFAITVYEGEKLQDVLAQIAKTGDTHPEFQNFQRFTSILNLVSNGMFRTFDEAHASFYGAEESKKAIAEQIAQNQEAGKPEEPGGKTPPPSGGSELLDRIARRGKGAAYSRLKRA